MSTVGEGRIGEAVVGVCATAAVVGFGAAVAIPLAGFVIAVAGLTVKATAIAGAGYVAIQALNQGQKLAIKAAKMLADEIKQEHQKAHQDQQRLLQEELKIKHYIFDQYRQSLLTNQAGQEAYLKSVLHQLDLKSLHLDRDQVETALLQQTPDVSHRRLDELTMMIQLVKQIHSLQATVQRDFLDEKGKKLFTNLVDEHDGLFASIPTLKPEAYQSLIPTLIAKRQALMAFIKNQAFYEASPEWKTLVQDLQFEIDTITLNPLIDLVKPTLAPFETQLFQTDLEAVYQQEILLLKQIVLAYERILDNMHQPAFVKLKNQLATIENFNQDPSLSLETKIEFTRRRRKALVLEFQKLETEHRQLLTIKKEFEALTYHNQIQRAKLGLPIERYQFQEHTYRQLRMLIQEENEVLDEKVSQLIQATVAHQALTQALESMQFDYIEDTLVSNDQKATVESLFHYKDGLVLKVTAKGKLVGFKMMRVPVPGKTLTDQDDLDNLSSYCRDVLPDLEKKLKAQGIIDSSLVVTPPSLEDLGTLTMEQIPHFKDRLIIEKSVKVARPQQRTTSKQRRK